MRTSARSRAPHRAFFFLLVAVALTTTVGWTRVAHAGEAAPVPELASSAITWSPRLLIQSDAVVARHGPHAPAIEDGTTHPGFYLRRARLGADVRSGVWRARIVVEAASQSETADAAGAGSGGGGATTGGAPAAQPVGPGRDPVAGEILGKAPRATEVFVALAPHKAFAVAAGALRVPIGLSRQIEEGDLRLLERARIVTRATPDFRVGVAMGGDLGLLQYTLGTYAAAPGFVSDSGSDSGSDFASGGALYVLRMSAEPVGPVGVAPDLRRHDDPWYDWWRFSTGLSVFYAQLPGSDEFGLGGDGQFQWKRFCVTGEVLWTHRGAVDRVGFSVEPGIFILRDRLEVVARAEWLNDDVGPRSPADAWGTSFGATFFSAARHARIHAGYTLRRPLAGDQQPTGWAMLRATFIL